MLYKLQQATQKVGLKISCDETNDDQPCSLVEKVIIEDTAIEIVGKYINLGHEMRISRDNQTAELRRTAFGKLRDIFKTKIPTKLKRKSFDQCVLLVLMERRI